MSQVRIVERGTMESSTISLVPSHEQASDGTMESRDKDKLVTIGIEVNGELRELTINISRGTQGNGRPLTEYFDRYEAETKKKNENGGVEGDFHMSIRLAQQALDAAQKAAAMGVIESRDDSVIALEVDDRSIPEALVAREAAA